MQFSNSIFRSYDIRGIVPSELDANISEHIGKALGTYALMNKLGNKFVVGEDDRSTSPELSTALIKGLTSTGCNVTYLGLTMTPVIHYLTCTEDFSFGINVTASHNPIEYNGFRLDLKDAVPFYGDQLQEIYKLILTENYITGEGSVENKDLFPLYLEHLKGRFSFNSATRIVIDCGNGSASVFAPRIFETLGCTVMPLYCDINSRFPHGVPDPENRLFMEALSKKVLAEKADGGFAFDTDVDRFGLVDDQGNIYDTDKTLLMFAEQKLKDHPGSEVLFDVKCSSQVRHLVDELGGVAKLMRTGHPYFVEEIRNGAILGCEYSGHAYFGGTHYGYDDGIFAACKAIQYSERQNKSFYQMLRKYPVRYHTSELKIPCPDKIKFEIIASIISIAKAMPNIVNLITLDGVRVEPTKTGWFLIRASNTSPMLSVRVEGIDNTEAKQMLAAVETLLAIYKDLDLTSLKECDIYIS